MKLFKVIICVFTAYGIYGQNVNKFAGVIKIQDTLLITYKIEFEERQGKISGYSITDAGGEHETKSKISGNYNDEKRLISFKEIEMVYTKSPVSMDNFDFCNIHLDATEFKLGSDKLIGTFKGRFSDGTKCIDGELAMNSFSKINKRVEKFSKKVENSNRIADSIKDKVKNIKIIDTLNLNVLKKNEITSIPTTSNAIKLYIYDGGQIDGDIISIYKDGALILSNYKITKNRKMLEVTLLKGKTQITILSESVGAIGSNTAIIEIEDGRNTIKTMTNIDKGEKTKIDVFRR